MRSFLLLLLLLMTGCEARVPIKVCPEGWIEFTFEYLNPNTTYQSVAVSRRNGKDLTAIKKDEWETEGRFSQYHDTKDKKVKMIIKSLQEKDFWIYECKFNCTQKTKELHLKQIENDGCQGEFIQTAYRTAETTIKCDYPQHKDKTSVKFFCKENNLTCEVILSTNSSLKSNGTFSLTETDSGFKVSISNVSSHDAGVYWCGVEKQSYQAGLRKIQLEVKNINTTRMSPTIGQSLTFMCEYPNGTLTNKFICKGEDPSVCTPLVSTSWTNRTSGKFFLTENIGEKNLTITVREVTAEDAGTYWCGAESTNETRSNLFFHRFLMTVDTSTSADGDFQFVIPLIICVAVLLLFLVLILILIKHLKNTGNKTPAQNNREDHVENSHERIQMSDLRDAAPTIYDNINLTTNPSASLLYSTLNFTNRSDKSGAEALVLKPGSVCEYSTVKLNQSPNFSTVNEPSRTSPDPLYSTVNKSK